MIVHIPRPRRTIYQRRMRRNRYRNALPIVVIIAALLAFWLYIGWSIAQTLERM